MAENNTYFINTEIVVDEKQAMQKIRKLSTEFEKTEGKLNKDNVVKLDIESNLAETEKAIEDLKDELIGLEDMRRNNTVTKNYTRVDENGNRVAFTTIDEEATAANNAGTDAEMARLNANLQEELKNRDELNKKLDEYNAKIKESEDLLAANRQQTKELQQAVAQMHAADATPAGGDGGVLKPERAKESASAIEKLGKRIGGLAKRVFVFSLITMGLRQVRKWIGAVLQQDEEASKAMAQLKGALLTLVQPLVSSVVPIITKLLHGLTQVVLYIAQFVNGLFGQSLATAAQNAEALYKNTKKANWQLAKFDELTTISNGDKNEPSFDFSGYDTDNPKVAQAAAKVRDVIIDIYSWINDKIKPLWDYFCNVTVPIILEGLGIIWDDVKQIAATSFEDAKRILDDMWNIVVDIADLIASLWDDTIDPETVMKKLVKDLVKFVLDALRAAIKGFFNLIKLAVDGLVWLLNSTFGLNLATPKAFEQGLNDIDTLFDDLKQGVDDWWAEDKKATADMSGRAKKLALEQIRQSDNTVVSLTNNTGKIADSFNDSGLRIQRATDGTLGKVEAAYTYSTRSIYNAVKGSPIPDAYEITARQALADYMNGVDWANGGTISSRDIARAFINAGVPADYAMTGAEACVAYFSQSWGQKATTTANEITTTTAAVIRRGAVGIGQAINDALTADPTTAAKKTAEAYSTRLAGYLSQKQYKLEAGEPTTTPDGKIIIRYNALPMAKGGVIPANRPFLAMLGDQTSGTNVEAPLSTIQEAVANVINGGETAQLLRTLIQVVREKDLSIGKSASLGRVVQQSMEMYQRVTG